MLRGLAEGPPAGRWLLWGPEAATAALAWPGAEIRPTALDPRRLLGQADSLRLPQGDLVVFMHHQRPLRATGSVTVVYDTIALRHGTTPPVRALKRLFLRRVARSSRQLVTISEYSKACIVRDLGVSADDVAVLRFPFDDAFVDRVLAVRRSTTGTDVALFIGGFLPHKNLPRLVAAFARTEFRREGGRLVLVGGSAREAERFEQSLHAADRSFVEVRHSCTQADVDHLFATSLFLVQPSLEEGFGLPPWEAMCCGLPVCVSDGGALPELTRGYADPFPAASDAAMTAAIDACAGVARDRDHDAAVNQSTLLRQRAPTVREFGLQFRAIVENRAPGMP